MSVPDERARWLEMGRLAELGLLSAEMLHELRQPLAAIRGSVQLMGAGVLPAGPGFTAVLLQQLDLIEGLVQRYATTGARARLRVEPIDLRAALGAVALQLGARARAHHKRLVQVVEAPAALLRADPVALHQVLVNLVVNAIDAAAAEVRLVEVEDGFAIVDDGPGIDPLVQAQIFEPFFTTKAPGEGTGLGLPIVRHLLHEIGGALALESSPGATCFRVTLVRGD